jgi:cytochrome c biogenesis protein CcdA
MHQVLFGTALLTSFLGGVVALLAPCCVSVMLPAYFATGFSRRSGIVAATGMFAAGVATLIVPIGLGASALSAALPAHHLLIFTVGGAAVLAGGAAVLAGWKPTLPMPSMRSPSGHGYGAAYGLGLFSGIASACCAPVLAGVVVLTGSTASFGSALAVSVTYVAGMVAPLAVLALVWEGRDWDSSKLLRGRRVQVGFGRLSRTMPLGTATSGIVLTGMGIVTLITAVTGPSMSSSGWRETMTAFLQHASSVTGRALSWLPGWAVLAVLAALAAGLLWQARRGHWRAEARAAPAEEADRPSRLPAGPGVISAQSDHSPQEAVTHER